MTEATTTLLHSSWCSNSIIIMSWVWRYSSVFGSREIFLIIKTIIVHINAFYDVRLSLLKAEFVFPYSKFLSFSFISMWCNSRFFSDHVLLFRLSLTTYGFLDVINIDWYSFILYFSESGSFFRWVADLLTLLLWVKFAVGIQSSNFQCWVLSCHFFCGQNHSFGCCPREGTYFYMWLICGDKFLWIWSIAVLLSCQLDIRRHSVSITMISDKIDHTNILDVSLAAHKHNERPIGLKVLRN